MSIPISRKHENNYAEGKDLRQIKTYVAFELHSGPCEDRMKMQIQIVEKQPKDQLNPRKLHTFGKTPGVCLFEKIRENFINHTLWKIDSFYRLYQ